MNIILAESHFNLFVVPVASETCEVLREAHRLAVWHSELLRAIMADQDAHGVAKKRHRLRVRSHGAGPELLRYCGGAGSAPVVLGEGRPRLSPLVVLFFLTLRVCTGR